MNFPIYHNSSINLSVPITSRLSISFLTEYSLMHLMLAYIIPLFKTLRHTSIWNRVKDNNLKPSLFMQHSYMCIASDVWHHCFYQIMNGQYYQNTSVFLNIKVFITINYCYRLRIAEISLVRSHLIIRMVKTLQIYGLISENESNFLFRFISFESPGSRRTKHLMI